MLGDAALYACPAKWRNRVPNLPPVVRFPNRTFARKLKPAVRNKSRHGKIARWSGRTVWIYLRTPGMLSTMSLKLVFSAMLCRRNTVGRSTSMPCARAAKLGSRLYLWRQTIKRRMCIYRCSKERRRRGRSLWLSVWQIFALEPDATKQG